jgi:hypothetical protein
MLCSKLRFSKTILGWSLAAIVVFASVQSLGQNKARGADPAAKKPAAATSPSHKPDSNELAWCLVLDVKRFVDSPIGKDVLRLAENTIATEAKTSDVPALRAKVAKVIGFDPLEDIESIGFYGVASPISVVGDGMVGTLGKTNTLKAPVHSNLVPENMLAENVLIAWLRGSTGNLEGLALALGQYHSTEYRGTTIHAGLLPDIHTKIYVAVRKPQSQLPACVIAGLRKDLVEDAIDRLASVNLSIPPLNLLVAQESSKAFLTGSLRLDDELFRAMPKVLPPPHSELTKLLRRLTVSVASQQESVVVRASVDLTDEKRAEQTQQLIQGVIAFMQLPIKEFEDNTAPELRKILADVTVTRSGKRVTCQLTRPAAGLLDELQKLAK